MKRGIVFLALSVIGVIGLIFILEEPALVEAQTFPSPVTIAVDPYGGGTQTGVVGLGGLQEKALTLELARLLIPLLEAEGFQTVLLRERDVDLPFSSRMMRAMEEDADLILSLQTGGAVNPEIKGPAVFVSRDWAQTPSGMLLSRVGVLIERELAVMKEGASRGVIATALAPRYKGPIPVVMIETAMLTNDEEARRINRPEEQALVAQAVARGLARAYQEPRMGVEADQ